MHDGARSLRPGDERMGPARLDHRHLVQAQRGGAQERARNGVGACGGEEAKATMSSTWSSAGDPTITAVKSSVQV